MLGKILLPVLLLIGITTSTTEGATGSFYLSSYCTGNINGTNASLPVIELPCTTLSDYRAGTIIISNLYSFHKCNFTLTVNGSKCASNAFTTYAIYLNVRTISFMALNPNDSVAIYEQGSLVKMLRGGYTRPPYPILSYAQLLSRYSRKPTLDFRFHTSENDSTTVYGSPYLTLEYVVLRERDAYDMHYESMCSALNGAILDGHYCDPSRVSCPTTYEPDLGWNPVTAVPAVVNHEYCRNLFPALLRTTRNPFSWPTYDPTIRPYRPLYNNSYSYTMETYQIVFVVFLSIALFIALLRLCVFCFCRTPAGVITTTSPTNSARPTPDHQTLVINGGAHAVDAAKFTISGNFLGAPPSYDTVCPAGPNGSSQDAARY